MPLQETIHKWTAGGAARWLNTAVLFLAMVALALWSNLASFKNLSTIEGFDNAQLARNLADGRGYTTDFVRPFSMHLLKKQGGDPQVRERHPDLANAPLYPVLLAGVLKAMPFPYPNVVGEKNVGAYAPDRWIAGFNQLLFILAVIQVFCLGSRLFDPRVGWLAAVVLAGTDLFWRFSLSGLPTLLACNIVLGLAQVLARVGPVRSGAGEVVAEESAGRLVGLSLLAGVLTGLAGLTRYSLGWLIVPVLIYFSAIPTTRRTVAILAVLVGFGGVLAPWLTRNYLVSGTLFGTAGYAVYEGTRVFPGFDLLRTLNPDFSLVNASDFSSKLLTGLREILENEAPRLGGNWVAAFFLVGLLVPFRNPLLNRLRLFLCSALLIFAVVQALGRTQVSVESPMMNAENLLVILAPLVFLFGVGLFQMLADQLAARDPGTRWATTGLLLLVSSAPLLLSLLRPEASALAYPPYHPRLVQEKAAQLKEDEWMMSDIPWAMAWYGSRQCVWLSLRYRELQDLQRPNDFAAMNQAGGKPLRALHLSNRMTKSVDTWGLWSWIHRAKREEWEKELSEWEAFLVGGAYAELQVPTGFPLKDAPFGLWPELFLIDSERETPKPIKGE
jgi:hypothetical protein